MNGHLKAFELPGCEAKPVLLLVAVAQPKNTEASSQAMTMNLSIIFQSFIIKKILSPTVFHVLTITLSERFGRNCHTFDSCEN